MDTTMHTHATLTPRLREIAYGLASVPTAPPEVMRSGLLLARQGTAEAREHGCRAGTLVATQWHQWEHPEDGLQSQADGPEYLVMVLDPVYDAPGGIRVPLAEWAEATASALARAYGGHSQYPARALAEAALGQRNNGGGRRPGRTRALHALAAWLSNRWPEGGPTAADDPALVAGWPEGTHGLPDEDGPMPEETDALG